MSSSKKSWACWLFAVALTFGLAQLAGCGGDEEVEFDCEAHDQCLENEACINEICVDAPELGDSCPASQEGEQYDDLVCADGKWRGGLGGPEIGDVTATPPTVDPGGIVELEVDVDDSDPDDLDYAWEAPEDWTLLEDDAPVVDLEAIDRPGETATIDVVVTDSADQTAEGDIEVSTHQVDGPEIQAIEAEPQTAIPGRLQTVTAEADHPEDHELDYQWELPEDWEAEEDLEGDTIEIRAPDEHDRSGDVELTVVDEFDQEISTTVNVQTEALFCGGDGTESTPWEVCSATFVNRIGVYDEDHLGDHFELTDDVDMQDLEDDQMYLIGDENDPFAGVFDGAGHVIENLEIDEDTDEVGLFGRTDDDAEIRDVTLDDADVEGHDHVAALVGRNEGTILDVTVSGSATGEANIGGIAGRNFGSVARSSSAANLDGHDATGGLVGHNLGELDEVAADGEITGEDDVGGLAGRNEGSITDAYSTAEVEGDDSVGGLVGTFESGTIENTYASGLTLGPEDRGGLVGDNLVAPDADVVVAPDSYWDVETTGVADSSVGTGLETAEFASKTTFSATWTFYPDDEFTWVVGEAADGEIRPLLEWQRPCDNDGDCSDGFCDQELERCVQCIASSDDDDGFGGGDGSADEPWRICTEQHLENLADSDDTSDHYRLFDDIELTSSWNDWDYIAHDPEEPFDGTFDGNGYSITDMDLATDITQPSLGLFGTIGTDGEVRNLTLENPEVAGPAEETGSLAGTNAGTIENCHAESVDVAGIDVVGGLVGANTGTIESSTVNGTVEASPFSSSDESAVAGGLIGTSTDNSEIRASSASVDVTADGQFSGVAGGLVGVLGGSTIEDSSAEGDVTAEADLTAVGGGLAGSVDTNDVDSESTVRTSYSNSQISASVHAEGFESGATLVGAVSGGLAGFTGVQNISPVFEDTYALSSTVATAESEEAPDEDEMVIAFAGGLVGWSNAAELRHSYAAGNSHRAVKYPGHEAESSGDAVVGSSAFEGQIGDFSITSVYYSTDHGSSETDAEGLTPDQFGEQATFEENDWDFTDVWTMGTTPSPDAENRPILQWQD